MNNSSILLFTLAAVSFFAAAGASVASELPTQKLSISFDLEKHLLHGTSEIILPPDTEGKYHFDTLQVSRVTIDGRELNLADRSQKIFADQDHPLSIPPSPTGSRVIVEYTKQTPPDQPSNADYISQDGITLTGVWHPFLHQEIKYELAAELPANFSAVSEAEEISVTATADNTNIVSFKFDQALPTINFIAGPYVVEQTTFGDNQELYTYFFEEDKDLAESYRDKTLGYLARYIDLIGPYPYKRFSVVENRLPTGYAMPTFTLLGQAVVRLPFITDTSLGHEVLHEWFGNAIGIDAAEGNWAEGLTTYLADQQFAAERGEEIDFRKNQLIKYQSYVPANNNIAPRNFLGSSSHSELSQKGIRAVGYAKVSLIFHMLKTAIGEEKFNQALGDFYQKMKFKRASWTDLAESFESVTHSKMTEFFHQWIIRPDLPAFSIEGLQVNEEEGQPLLTFVLKQTSTQPYEIDVPITINTGREKIKRIITMTGLQAKVEIPLDDPPREMLIDENYDLMRHLAPDELPPVWSGFEGAGDKLAVIGTVAEQDLYQPLMKILAQMGCEMKPAEQVTDKDVAKGSTIFLGATSRLARSIFADPAHPATGFTVDIHRNPLNPARTAILVTAENQEEVARAAHKLTHYGRYSYLHFEKGRIMEKRTAPADMGIGYFIDVPPGGIEIKNNLSFDAIMEKISDQRVVYIGESHTRVEDHNLQLRVIRAMYAQNPNLAIGMEMFNRDVAPVLDNYVAGDINELEFLKQSHYFSKWGFDYRFYQPIINFARRHRLTIVPLNLDKGIVSKVYQETGISGLSQEETAQFPDDRDLDLPGYRDRISMVHRMHNSAQHNNNEQLNNFIQAQVLWDETMAESIADYLANHPLTRMAVIAGRGHVDKENAIPPRVHRRLPVGQKVILNVEQQEVDAKTADFLLFSSPAQLPPPPLMGVMLAEKDNMVKIDNLSPHGGAQKAGIKKNDIFLALDDIPVTTVEEIKLIMFPKKKGDKVRVKVKRVKKFWPDSQFEVEIPL